MIPQQALNFCAMWAPEVQVWLMPVHQGYPQNLASFEDSSFRVKVRNKCLGAAQE